MSHTRVKRLSIVTPDSQRALVSAVKVQNYNLDELVPALRNSLELIGGLSTILKPGDKVYTGQNIALMGGQPGMAGAGNSTGCHLHFEVVGAKNPLSVYVKGATISYK